MEKIIKKSVEQLKEPTVEHEVIKSTVPSNIEDIIIKEKK